MSADPADDWILDPDTGEYRMRLPGERLTPAAPVPARVPSPGAEVELRATREMEIVRPQAAPPPRAAGRAAERNARRGGRRRDSGSGGGGGLWLVVVLGVVGVAGCGFGGYLLLDGGSKPQTACSAGPAAPTPTPSAAGPTDAGPAAKAGPHAEPINVRVSVYDGSGKFGSAESVLSWMQNKQGYLRTSNEGPVAPRATTSLVYEPPHADQARTLAATMHLPFSDLHDTGKGDGLRDPMVLTLGKDFNTPGQAPSAPAVRPPAPAADAHPGCTPS
ncbi:LytR C-terminal domain-containing protein [Streptantibioticus silvisoli]|uniref:LytR C-terminal domain-containing protein n=1 Tax=Streptantibioticus silvisoli TaxID=2705255 RepID=A0ABT6WA93_9ACTN|nr:LytR C-terminal domain-containing protein [Streptantibioticus silvisoli]MDI5967142.1 LytR C-terminal domain-containing protein [Streptantibioticus silvisoli]